MTCINSKIIVDDFCQSCDICQRTIPKGKIVKATLGKMPRIDVPFKRVATDLIGPLKPVTYNQNRYILTLVDYATRYPEAVSLASIDTETVAEALVSIFSRVGIPNMVLTDMGTQYTSVTVSISQTEQNGNKTLTGRRPMEDGKRTRYMYQGRKVSLCNITDGCRPKADEGNRKGLIIWIFSFMAMMVMMIASCIGQWTCT